MLQRLWSRHREIQIGPVLEEGALQPHWRRTLKESADDFERCEQLPAIRLDCEPKPPRLQRHHGVGTSLFYQDRLTKSAQIGGWVGAPSFLAGAAWSARAVLRAKVIGDAASFIVAHVSLSAGFVAVLIGASIVGVTVAGAWLGRRAAEGLCAQLCFMHRAYRDRQAQNALATHYQALRGASADTVDNVTENIRALPESRPHLACDGRRGVFEQAVEQLTGVAQRLRAEDEKQKRRMQTQADEKCQQADEKCQQAADMLRSEALGIAADRGEAFARQHLHACAAEFPTRHPAREGLRLFAQEMEAAFLVARVIQAARTRLEAGDDTDHTRREVAESLRQLQKHHPLLGTTENGRMMLNRAIAALGREGTPVDTAHLERTLLQSADAVALRT